MAKNRLYGIGEPLTMRALAEEIDADRALDIMGELGVTAMREWMHLDLLLKDPVTPNPEAVAAYAKTLDRCAAMDIEVTGMSHGWFLPESCGSKDHCAMPHRDHTPGSVYMQTLEMMEQSWFTMVSQFPQVPQWEVGNEWNFSMFLHPLGWKYGDPSFDFQEAMGISADIMFYAARGIRRANPKALVVSFSPTPLLMDRALAAAIPGGYAIAICLEEIYRVIEAGESFSTRSDDYFDLLAWHPYLSSQMGYAPIIDQYPAEKAYMPDELPDARWRSFSDAAYNVMARHGDGHKQVLITEFGFSDAGDPAREQQQAELIRDVYAELAKMPYIRTIHWFRLFEAEAGDVSAPKEEGAFQRKVEAKFGIIREPVFGYQWRNKARVLSEIYHA